MCKIFSKLVSCLVLSLTLFIPPTLRAQIARAGSASVYRERGQNWVAKGEWERASSDYSLALSLEPSAPNDYNRANARYDKGELVSAASVQERPDPQLLAFINTIKAVDNGFFRRFTVGWRLLPHDSRWAASCRRQLFGSTLGAGWLFSIPGGRAVSALASLSKGRCRLQEGR